MLITQAAWARNRGFSRQYVSRLVKNSVVRLVDGKIDPAAADAALAAMREPARLPQRSVAHQAGRSANLPPQPALRLASAPEVGFRSTLIACETLGRQARLVELDPGYCDVTVRRWQAFTDRAAPSPALAADAGQDTGQSSSNPVGQMHGSFSKARTVREHYRAMRERLEYETIAGGLISRDDVQNAAFETGLFMRNQLEHVAMRLAHAIAEKCAVDQKTVREITDREVSEALGNTSRKFGELGR